MELINIAEIGQFDIVCRRHQVLDVNRRERIVINDATRAVRLLDLKGFKEISQRDFRQKLATLKDHRGHYQVGRKHPLHYASHRFN